MFFVSRNSKVWSAAKPEVSLDFLKAAAVPIFDVTSGGDAQRTLPN